MMPFGSWRSSMASRSGTAARTATNLVSSIGAPYKDFVRMSVASSRRRSYVLTSPRNTSQFCSGKASRSRSSLSLGHLRVSRSSQHRQTCRARITFRSESFPVQSLQLSQWLRRRRQDSSVRETAAGEASACRASRTGGTYFVKMEDHLTHVIRSSSGVNAQRFEDPCCQPLPTQLLDVTASSSPQDSLFMSGMIVHGLVVTVRVHGVPAGFC
mmetsp:Transcript_4917/g.13140  ORF Transcript_4917/g.13140 Transcript_4917/m.13140 type:complete len:213 (+) Transcript_4917:146-784(+)